MIVPCALAWCLSGCGPPPPQAPNVVFISLDTVRAQNMSCYGYSRDTTPRIAEWAGGATLYRRAIASAPWTLPSHASMFTGLEPVEHGAQMYQMANGELVEAPLDTTHPTLAEVLRDKGYQTAAIVANTGKMDWRSQLNRGFEEYLLSYKTARELNDELVLPWLEEHGRDGAFFLFLNFMDAHDPYNSAPIPGFLEELETRNSKPLLDAVRLSVMRKERPRPEKELALLEGQYDTALRHLDNEVDRLMTKLRELGLYDSTVIILTSDHGEYFGEHDYITHWQEVYQEVVWVPLIIKWPGQTEGREESSVAVSHVDLAGMILRSLPEEVVGEHFEDFSRVPGSHPVISSFNCMSKLDMKMPEARERLNRERVAVIEWPHKYIRSSDGEHELYNLETDPGEQANLVVSEPEAASRLERQLGDYLSGLNVHPPPAGPEPVLNSEEEKLLRKLGYL